MPLDSFLTIFGTIATIVFGILGIVLVKNNKYGGKISFLIDQNFQLYNSKLPSITGLKIQYEEKEIVQNMSLISIFIINHGKIDISKEMTEKSLKLILDKKHSILRYRLTALSDNLKCHIDQVDSNQLYFNLGLFRVDEFFKIELLIAGDRITDFNNTMTFSHRIAQTGLVNQIKIDITKGSSDHIKEKLKRTFLFGIMGLLLTVLLTTVNYQFSKKDLTRELSNYTEYNGLFMALQNIDKLKKELNINIKIDTLGFQPQLKKEYGRIQRDLENYNFSNHLLNKNGGVSMGIILLYIILCCYLFFDYKTYQSRFRVLKTIQRED